MYSPGCPGTHSVDQPGLELRDLSLIPMLGLKLYATTAQQCNGFLMLNSYLFSLLLNLCSPSYGLFEGVGSVSQVLGNSSSVGKVWLASCYVCVDSLGFYPVLFMLIFLGFGL